MSTLLPPRPIAYYGALGVPSDMATRLVYMVIATLPDAARAEEYVAWLEDGHVDAVIKGGAHSAMIVRLHTPTVSVTGSGEVGSADSGPHRVMTQYVFPTQEVFDQYVQRHAPALRAEGIKRFGPDTGVKFERLLGDIV